MLDIKWSNPYAVKVGFTTKWKREWCIPVDMLNGFFEFWKKNRFKMLNEGFNVSRNETTGRWHLYETKDKEAAFQSIIDRHVKSSKPEEIFILPPYTLKKSDGLREWQVGAAEKIVSALNHWGAAVDGSELGTGKTYTSCGVARELNVPFVIVCPKPVIHQWNKVINNHFKLKDFCKGIINYELLIRGRKDSAVASYILSRQTKRKRFEWKVPKKTLIIWDEAHRLKNWKTKASKSCIEAFKQGYQQLFLSATLASSPLDLRTVGVCTGLFTTAGEYYAWARDHGVYDGNWGMEFNNDANVLKKIHTYLFNHRGVRLQRDVIPNFPETEIIVNAYDMDEEDASKIRAIYAEMKSELKVLDGKKKADGDNEMAIRIRALQKAEMLKVPLMEEMIREGMDAGMSVVVFLNYSDSIDALASRMGTKCIYDGRNQKDRQNNIELFQSNKETLLITNIAAAREGINLQDLDGTHPRLSLFSPPYSIIKLKQALGRVHRENSKSKSIQKIIYIANTQEEAVVESVGKKLENLTLINNGEITDNDLKI
jgi:superfamily II DNA or RNA helicase